MSLIATSRLFTGKPVSRGYLVDTESGRVVWACPHEHPPMSNRFKTNGPARAKKCAERELHRRAAEQGEAK